MSWWEGIKAACKVLPRLGDLDPYEKIRRLEDELDRERECRRDAEEEVRRLEASLERSERIEDDRNICWRLDEEGNRDHPICAHCLNAEGITIPLSDPGAGGFHCPHCDNYFEHEAATDTRPHRNGSAGLGDLFSF